MHIAAIVVVCVLIIVLIASYVFSNVIIHSRRQPVVVTPGDYGLAYEDVAFASDDGIALSGWYMPANRAKSPLPDRVVIITHPMTFNRHGFVARSQGFPPLFRTDVDLMPTAVAFHNAGYGVLMFDLRNHGDSGGGLSGVGLTEYQDVVAALDYVRSRDDLVAPRVGFVSFCMGADSTIVALSRAADRMRDVRFLVAVQPVSAAVFVRCYMRNMYTPVSLFMIPIVDLICKLRGGFRLQAMSPLEYARDVHVPALYIQAEQDPWTELSDIQAMYDATPGVKELWLLPDVTRRFDTYNHVGQHPERLLAFAEEHVA